MTFTLLLLLSSCRTIENINYNTIQIVEDDCCCGDDNDCCDEDENNCAVDNDGTTTGTTSPGTTTTTPIDTGETSVHTGETGRDTGGDPCAEYISPTLPKVVVDETCLTSPPTDEPELANLEATGVDYCDACASGYIELWIPLINDGLIAGGPFDIELYDVSTLVYSETIANVNSGEAMLIGPIMLDSTQWTGELTLSVDAGYVVDECNEIDNILKLGEWPCP
jgi:hypothetical protein